MSARPRGMIRTKFSVVNDYPYAPPIMAHWLAEFITYMTENHGIRLVIIKVAEPPRKTYNGVSGSTHRDGYAVDIRSWNLTPTQRNKVIREAGRLGLILHYRTKKQGFDPHLHGMLNIDAWTYSKYQITATARGFSGLGKNGLGSRDNQASLRPSLPYPTAQTGLQIMRASHRTELERLLDSMNVTDLRKIIRDETRNLPAAVLKQRITVTRSGKRDTRSVGTLIASHDAALGRIAEQLAELEAKLENE